MMGTHMASMLARWCGLCSLRNTWVVACQRRRRVTSILPRCWRMGLRTWTMNLHVWRLERPDAGRRSVASIIALSSSEIDRAHHTFQWSSCSSRPDNWRLKAELWHPSCTAYHALAWQYQKKSVKSYANILAW